LTIIDQKCKQCGWEWTPRIDPEKIKLCPNCRRPTWNKEPIRLQCYYCDHEWTPLIQEREIAKCPKCGELLLWARALKEKEVEDEDNNREVESASTG